MESVPRVYKKAQSEDATEYRTVVVKWSSPEGIELGRLLEMAVEGDWEEIARKELGGAKKTSCVIWNDSESFIYPLPGYD
jgi:hypothetical protein